LTRGHAFSLSFINAVGEACGRTLAAFAGRRLDAEDVPDLIDDGRYERVRGFPAAQWPKVD
jgi:hypothetical protein